MFNSKVVIQKNDLLNALGHVQSIVERRNAIPALSNVKIDIVDNNMKLTTTDMDISAMDIIPVVANQSFSTTIPVLTLFEIVKKIPDNSDITFENNADAVHQLHVLSGSSKFNLPCLSVEEFPSFDHGTFPTELSIDANSFRNMLNKVKHAISSEETRYYLNGAFLHLVTKGDEKFLSVVATDGHRLAKSEVKVDNIENFNGIIIPRKTVLELVKLLDGFDGAINVKISPNKCLFEIGTCTLISKLIDGKFPDYNRVIPADNDKIVEISTSKLKESIELVISVASDKTKAVKLEVRPSEVILTASSDSNGTASGRQVLPVSYDSETVSLGFNSRYVLECLSVIQGDVLRMKISNAACAILIEDSADSLSSYVLMPMEV